MHGGGIKGATHIGVLKVLEEENIKIDYISGASSGSIVATLFAVGYTADEIYNIFKEYAAEIKYFEFKNLFKLLYGIIFKRKVLIDGLNSGKKINKIIEEKCIKKGITNINQIRIPLLIPSVDLYTGKLYCFTSKEIRGEIMDDIIYDSNIEIGKAVQASCSYPLIFSPCNVKNMKLIDGGIRENIPWKGILKMGADKVISVVFEKDLLEKSCNNIIDVVDNSINILKHELANYELLGADYLIKIKTKNIGLLDINKIDELYNLGYKITKNQITKIKKIINT